MKSPVKSRVSSSVAQTSACSITSVVLIITGLVWLLAVIKCFLLEYGAFESRHERNNAFISNVLDKVPLQYLTDRYLVTQQKLTTNINNNKNDISADPPPSLYDWLYIRSGEKVIPHIRSKPVELIEPSQDSLITAATNTHRLLEWPPVLADGSVPAADGFDIMPFSGIKVPRFWQPQGDVLEIGSKVNGHETIFLMIASYRDFQCKETIASAFNRADHPERLFVGAVDQLTPGDTGLGCLDVEVPCAQKPDQPLCKYRSQIAVYTMDATTASGPVTARHIGDRLYRGQYFVMQMDAHCMFVRHWDTLLTGQFRSTGNEMAVLSSYLTDLQGSIDANGDSLRDTRPIMCNSDFEGAMPARYLRHGAQPEEVPAIKEMPQLQPYWAAGFSFSRGHFKVQVPYDAYQPMVFQGEEIAIGIRGFTYGYDFYAPRDSVVFHEYAALSGRRKKVHMFWENQRFAGMGKKSLMRATGIIGMAPDLDPALYDHTEEAKYGLGTGKLSHEHYIVYMPHMISCSSLQCGRRSSSTSSS